MNEGIFAPAWMADALCAQVDPAIFHPHKGGSNKPAKAVCAACPARAECLDYALELDERHGIFGGLSPEERTTIRRAVAA